MAESNMAITAANITTFADEVAVDPDLVDSTITEITETIDDMLETEDGHDHDGSNSKSVSAGIGSLTTEEYTLANLLGGDL